MKDMHNVSADELHHREELQEKHHDAPLRSVTDVISDAISRVLSTLGVDVSQSDELIKQQQETLGIVISEHRLEEMGELSGFYIQVGDVPHAIVGDPFLASDGLAYLKIFWVQKNKMETYGGIKIR